MAEWIEVTDDICNQLGLSRKSKAVSLITGRLEKDKEYTCEETKAKNNRKTTKYCITKNSLQYLQILCNPETYKDMIMNLDADDAPTGPVTFEHESLFVHKSPSKNAYRVCRTNLPGFLCCYRTRWSGPILSLLDLKYPKTKQGDYRGSLSKIRQAIEMTHAFYESVVGHDIDNSNVASTVCSAILNSSEPIHDQSMKADAIFADWFNTRTVKTKERNPGIRGDALYEAFKKYAEKHAPWIREQVSLEFVKNMIEGNGYQFGRPLGDPHTYVRHRIRSKESLENLLKKF
ncbi:hypothetical protein GGF31_003433 [Allomyces arbusculus]|nr:hypothetical protein GGF31_003433 [Allomyces arbusculus]